jgi:hypothetical protein
MEKKRINIFKGLIDEEEVNWLYTSLIGENEKLKRITAPIRAIIQ